MRLVIPHRTAFVDELVRSLGVLRTEDGRAVHIAPITTAPFPVEDALVLTEDLLAATQQYAGAQLLVLSAMTLPGATCFGTRDGVPGRFSMREIAAEGLAEMTDQAMALLRGWKRGALIVDLSVVDPAFAPSLRHALPGGLTARELITVVQRFRLIRELRSAAVVVDADRGMLAGALAARVVTELL